MLSCGFASLEKIGTLTFSRYISALEERIAFLEARLPDHAEDHLDGYCEITQQTSPTSTHAGFSGFEARRGSCRESHNGSNSEDLEFDDGTSLVDGVAYLSLCASGTTDTSQGPFYVGSSSGATIARMIQSSIYQRSNNRRASWSTAHQNNTVLASVDDPAQSVGPEANEPTITLPSCSQARMLFEFFFERIHPRWPLLDRAVYEQIFVKQYLLGALTITQRSILHLIYAITARFLAVTKKPCGVDDEVSVKTLLFLYHG